MNRVMRNLSLTRVSNGWIVTQAGVHNQERFTPHYAPEDSEVARTPKELASIVEKWAAEQDKAAKEAAKVEAKRA